VMNVGSVIDFRDLREVGEAADVWNENYRSLGRGDAPLE